MAQAINQLSTAVSPATYKYTSVDTPNAGRQNLKATEARIIGGNVRVVNSGTITAGEEKAFTYSFPGEFKYTPIATATPINTGNTVAGKNVTVILKSVSTSGLEGIVRFNTSGDLSIDVNLIIIGIPN
jgi:hypothetical protein